MKQTIRLLTIDGGGMRGLIPAMFLAALEERAGKPAAQLFDMIAGTSTGGILALGLAKPDAAHPGRPQYRARDLIDLYKVEGKRIFKAPVGRQLVDERYPAEGIEGVLKSYFGETRFNEALTELLVTAYDIQMRRPHLFKTRHAADPEGSKHKDHDFLMWQVARATSAAATFFEVAKLDKEGAPPYLALLDGGTFANNPSLCAYIEAKKLYPEAEVLLVSLGVGRIIDPLDYDEVRNWNLFKWLRPLFDLVLEGASDNVDYLTGKLVPEENYYRFQVQIGRKNQMLDNTSKRNIQQLIAIAEKGIAGESQRLDELAARLVEHPSGKAPARKKAPGKGPTA